MAKSLRSKRKRKFRAVQREQVYGPRELKRLKETLAKAPPTSLESEMVTVTSAKEIQDKMDIDSKYDKKTKRDENGHYPAWMNQRAVKKHKSQLKKKSKKKGGKK